MSALADAMALQYAWLGINLYLDSYRNKLYIILYNYDGGVK